MITLVTMAAGNPLAFLKTLESTAGVVDEIIFGDMLLFPEDRQIVESYQNKFNLRIVKLPFDFIFHGGFGTTLNVLANFATNDWILYLNVSEIISEGKDDVLCTLASNPECNTFFFDHATDPHRWHRLYRKSELHWEGLIHEEVGPHELYRPYHKPIFRMADLPKDDVSPFKARVLDDCKEIVYFQQYMRLVEKPELLGFTNEGWLNFSRDNYDSMKERLLKKGARYDAYCQRKYNAYMREVFTDPDFENVRFESGIGCEFQSIPKSFLL